MPRRPRLPALADEHAAEGGVATLDRALSILGAFSMARPTPGLAEIAAHTRISKSTVLRMLASLQHAGLVVRLADGRYALGAAVERLQRVRAASVSVEAVGWAWMGASELPPLLFGAKPKHQICS